MMRSPGVPRDKQVRNMRRPTLLPVRGARRVRPHVLHPMWISRRICSATEILHALQVLQDTDAQGIPIDADERPCLGDLGHVSHLQWSSRDDWEARRFAFENAEFVLKTDGDNSFDALTGDTFLNSVQSQKRTTGQRCSDTACDHCGGPFPTLCDHI